jgi:hypothetical protein
LRPDIDEQHEIARRIEKTFAWIDRLASETTSARQLIDHLDQAATHGFGLRPPEIDDIGCFDTVEGA